MVEGRSLSSAELCFLSLASLVCGQLMSTWEGGVTFVCVCVCMRGGSSDDCRRWNSLLHVRRQKEGKQEREWKQSEGEVDGGRHTEWQKQRERLSKRYSGRQSWRDHTDGGGEDGE